MKRALAGVFVAAALVGCMAVGAMAQIPYVQVYFDDGSNGSYGETQAYCGQAGMPVYMYVVGQNFNSWLSGVEYSVQFPAGILFIGDTLPPTQGATVTLGNSRDGFAITYELPRSGFVPVLFSTIFALWTAECDCAGGPQSIVVGPYPYPVDPQTKPRGVRWPDLVPIPAVGMTSLLCPGPVATQESTWGGIKALYR
jgi:hypothetical protein